MNSALFSYGSLLILLSSLVKVIYPHKCVDPSYYLLNDKEIYPLRFILYLKVVTSSNQVNFHDLDL